MIVSDHDRLAEEPRLATSVSPPEQNGFDCSVRYEPDGESPLSTAQAVRMCRFAEQRGRSWGSAICSYLGVVPAQPVKITLRPGIMWSMTKGVEVVVGVSPGTVSAALTHELVHAVAGRSPRQVYDEGLAVHVDAQLQLAGPTWPFFHLRPHRWVRHFVDDGTFLPLSDLMEGPRVMPSETPGLSDAVRFYLEAGSFVGFVIELLGGFEAFWRYFRAGEPVASPNGFDLGAMWVASLGPALTADERHRRDASLPLLADDGRFGLASNSARPPAAGQDR